MPHSPELLPIHPVAWSQGLLLWSTTMPPIPTFVPLYGNDLGKAETASQPVRCRGILS